jgi:outer membrane biosynthesis protein TonB
VTPTPVKSPAARACRGRWTGMAVATVHPNLSPNLSPKPEPEPEPEPEPQPEPQPQPQPTPKPQPQPKPKPKPRPKPRPRPKPEPKPKPEPRPKPKPTPTPTPNQGVGVVTSGSMRRRRLARPIRTSRRRSPSPLVGGQPADYGHPTWAAGRRRRRRAVTGVAARVTLAIGPGPPGYP